MRKFLTKSLAALATAAFVFCAPVAAEAADSYGDNEAAVLEWIAANAEGGEDSTAYKVMADQFAYTKADVTADQAATIKENIKAVNEMKDAENTAENQLKLLEHVQEAAKAAGGNAIALSDSESLESSVAFVRFDEENPKVIVEVQMVDSKDEVVPYEETTMLTIEGEQYPIVAGATVTEEEEGVKEIDGTKYQVNADGTFYNVSEVDVVYFTHVQNKGDMDPVKNGKMSGTQGESKRLEAITIDLEGNEDLGITYTTHVQNYGWLPWSSEGEASGTQGESKRLEAIQIKLTGAAAENYDVYYRVHAQNYGWLNWAKNGEKAGTAGYSKRLEGIQIVVVSNKVEKFDPSAYEFECDEEKAFIEKEGSASDAPETAVPSVMYKTHVQQDGWQNWVMNGTVSGTEGRSLRLEGINIKLTNKDYEGGIKYTTHVQNIGWQDAVADGAMAGTEGQSKRLEGIRIELTGEMSNQYDVYYRVHAQNYGWLGWAKNGEDAGTEGLSKRLEGIQIVLVKKGEAAPAATFEGITSDDERPFVK
ncbi:MAG: Ig domain-containing protein [Lachnospiraceae bacterium]|nr:Ig domain-containing protein [Lachnospiraceae bacterium]MBQ8166749.1 Ig domain-containing protein [Lachnospiraceae bacterium]